MKERNIDRIVQRNATTQILGSLSWDLVGIWLLWTTGEDALEKLSAGRWWELAITGVIGLLFAWFGVSTFFETCAGGGIRRSTVPHWNGKRARIEGRRALNSRGAAAPLRFSCGRVSINRGPTVRSSPVDLEGGGGRKRGG